jgi:choline dehydrogenase-like flavoprotein
MLTDIWDFIVVGGGLAGSVLASRLFDQNNKLSILVVEAGPDVSNNTIIPYANNTALLIGSDLDWSYLTEPQTGLDNRLIDNPAGKALGGGTAINGCKTLILALLELLD